MVAEATIVLLFTKAAHLSLKLLLSRASAAPAGSKLKKLVRILIDPMNTLTNRVHAPSKDRILKFIFIGIPP